ncbi:methylated-DNA--[protein]-cysteine S-methyltransferase [Pseudaestuariivita sp.]|uniref:methylated-DNA--[protein]-cysteine S-methyltransferase n=1 Tax=Pseudaestuariivita sp. TaxID=2211669 RepID=UPI004057CD02
MPRLTVDTPTGPITLTQDGDALVAADWESGGSDWTPLLTRAADQLTAYFAGVRQSFDVPLDVRASDFQQQVCAQMAAIPFGETTTYGAIAKALGAPAQAVGQACGGNPLPVLIPCHRVLGAGGLGGYSGRGGVETKVWLLRHEGAGGLLI